MMIEADTVSQGFIEANSINAAQVPPMHYVQVRHNFETAHRLPMLPGKCQSLHGHSWWVDITIRNMRRSNGIDENGVSIEYGSVKALIRNWIDTYLDHGVMLGVDDPLVRPLLDEGNQKLFIFGQHTPPDMRWPTVENVAGFLHVLVEQMLADRTDMEMAKVVRVKVQETAVNTAITGWMD